MTSPITRLEEISEEFGYPEEKGHAFMFIEWNGLKDFEHVLISRMEEAIAYTVAGHHVPFFFAIRQDLNDEYDVMGHTHKSRLEATFTAWQAIKEQQQ